MDTEFGFLKWKGRANHLQAIYVEFLEKEICCDVTLATGKERFKAHLFVLAACSPYFKDILTNITPGQYPVIFLKETTSQEIKWLLEYMYKGEVAIPQESLRQFIIFGESLGITGLYDTENGDVSHFLEICATPENASQAVNEGDTSLTPEMESPIITNYIKRTPHKRFHDRRSGRFAKKCKVQKDKQKQLNKIELSLTQSGNIYNEKGSSIDVFDESGILNSPPRSPSVIFDINNVDHGTETGQIENQSSVILLDEEEDVIVEISDVETHTESPDLSMEFDNSNREFLTRPTNPAHVVNPYASLVAEPDHLDDSDDSEIKIIRKSTPRRVLFDSSDSSEEPSAINTNKELRVVLNRCAKGSSIAGDNL